MTTTITEQSPRQIDTTLADLHEQASRATARLTSAAEGLHAALGERRVRNGYGRRPTWPTTTDEALTACRARLAAPDYREVPYGYSPAKALATYEAADAALTAICEQAAPLHEEYARRPWSRFFVVAGGHIHSSMHCSTCNNGREPTRFGWNPDLSGLTEAEAVQALGPSLCTVCFPSAPVEWTVGTPRRTREQVAADKAAAAKQARIADPKLIAAPDGTELRVGGNTLRTVRSAEIAAVDALVWAAYARHVGTPNEPHARELEAHARQIAAALAHKAGTTEAAEMARLTDKAIAKTRRDLGTEVAAAAAAHWAAN